VDELKEYIARNSNKIAAERSALTSINRSLSVKSDVLPSRINEMYKEAGFYFANQIVKRLDEVKSFHEELTTRRSERLSKEMEIIHTKIRNLETESRRLRAELDEHMAYLGAHGAIDQYADIAHELADKENELANLERYKQAISELKQTELQTKETFARLDKESNEYLLQAESVLAFNKRMFRSYSREFYQDKPGTIEVINNEGENQIRFSINAKIEDDASDGINEVKIFCFDYTILNARHGHDMRFLFHDSRLFSDMDPRQRATLLKTAYLTSGNTGDQYIASMNEDMLESMREYFSEPEFKDIIENSTILELTDESADTKLLGVQVDMNYD
jgi:uncharacterized protein YydD (DUF2326 family)